MNERLCKSCGYVGKQSGDFYSPVCPACSSEDTEMVLPVNKFGGYCKNCKEYVKAGAGWYTKQTGVNHYRCEFKTKSWKDIYNLVNSLPLFKPYDHD